MEPCVRCPHPRGAHGAEGSCLINGCGCSGFLAEGTTARPVPPRHPNIPVLIIPAAPVPEGGGFPVTIGIPDMLFDGQPFPWTTVDEWRLSFEQDGFATLTVSIPVAIGPNAEPADD